VAVIRLTRAEEAYAHLASFKRGDKVDVAGRTTPPLGGVVTTPQQHDWSDINRAYLYVTSDDGTVDVKITVGLLLAGHYTITRKAA